MKKLLRDIGIIFSLSLIIIVGLVVFCAVLWGIGAILVLVQEQLSPYIGGWSFLVAIVFGLFILAVILGIVNYLFDRRSKGKSNSICGDA